MFGGLPVGSGDWKGHILLIEPRHQLRATGNILHIEQREIKSGLSDEFIIDNVVIVYKTRPGLVVEGNDIQVRLE